MAEWNSDLFKLMGQSNKMQQTPYQWVLILDPMMQLQEHRSWSWQPMVICLGVSSNGKMMKILIWLIIQKKGGKAYLQTPNSSVLGLRCHLLSWKAKCPCVQLTGVDLWQWTVTINITWESHLWVCLWEYVQEKFNWGRKTHLECRGHFPVR